ncbi:MAG: class I tRNA ligase family protein, partial [Clostridia bacterium]|nr:class I tRNA ligase family protein [Clostridia bacterium]
SKSLGNGVDPLEIIDKFGADALRFMLATGNSPGNDMRYSDEKVSASRNFANKLWNASRFIMMNLGEENIPCEIPADLALEDKWVISLFNDLVKEVTDNLEKFELGIAVAKLYDFVWDIFCDWYIELAKIRLQSGNKDVKQVLVYIMTGILKLLHPFMPFITEEIYQTIPHGDEALMISAWPEYDGALTFAAEEAEMDRIMKAIRAIRNRRSEMNVPPSRKAKVIIVSTYKDTFAQAGVFMQRLASASDVELADEFSDDTAVCIVTEDAKIYIPMGDLIDFEAEKARLSKELDAAKKDLEFVNNKHNNEYFVPKAPEAVVSAQREQAAKLSEKIAMLEDSIKQLG